VRKAGGLEAAVTVGGAHHGNLDSLIAQSGDTSGPFSFDRGPPFELKADLAKEIDRRCEVIDNDSYVVHPFKPHVSNLQDVVCSDNVEASIGAARRCQFRSVLSNWRKPYRRKLKLPI
jgi:hypothetical protein